MCIYLDLQVACHKLDFGKVNLTNQNHPQLHHCTCHVTNDWSDRVSKDSKRDKRLCKLQYACLFERMHLILLTLSVSSVSGHSPSHQPGGLLSSMSGHRLGSYHSMGHQCSWNWSPGCHMTAISVCVCTVISVSGTIFGMCRIYKNISGTYTCMYMYHITVDIIMYYVLLS